MCKLFSKRRLDRTCTVMYAASKNKLTEIERSSPFVEKSMLPLLPVLSKFPFVGIQPSVNIYAMIQFEPMNGLSFGVGKMLKECIVLMLGSETITCFSVGYTNGNMRLFRSLKQTFLSTLNTFVR